MKTSISTTSSTALRGGEISHEFAPPPVITPREFHQATGQVIGLNAIYELLRANRIRHVKVGTRYLILASETRAFFEREAYGGWVR